MIFVDTRDIAAVAIKILIEGGHAGQIYNITEAEPLTSAERAQIFSEVLGYPVQYVPVTDEQAEQTLAQFGVPTWLNSKLTELTQFLRAESARLASSAVQDVTGQAPITFRQFVQDYREAFARSS